MILAATDDLRPGDLVRVTISIAGFRPSDADIHSALQAEGLSVARVETPLFGQTSVWLRVDLAQTAGELAKRVADAIDRHFLLVVDADAVGYERVSALPPAGSGPLGGVSDVLRWAFLLAVVVVAIIAVREIRELTK
jgi:hypothetical protein